MAEALDLVSNILQTIPITATASLPLQASMAVLRVKLQAKLGESGDVGMVAFGCKTVTVIIRVSVMKVEIMGEGYLTSMHKQPKEYISHLVSGQGRVSSPSNLSSSGAVHRGCLSTDKTLGLLSWGLRERPKSDSLTQ